PGAAACCATAGRHRSPRDGRRARRAPRLGGPSSACTCGTARASVPGPGAGAGGSSATRAPPGRRTPRAAGAAALPRRSTRGTGRPTRRSGEPAHPSRLHERMLLAHPEGRARVVDEAALVLEQRLGGGAPVDRRGGRDEVLDAVPPQLGDAVER